MKLVDILARELRVWPEGVFSLSQLQHNGAIINGKGYDGREWGRLQIADDTPPAGVLVTEGQWQAAVDAPKAEKVPAWVGIGLPPVGIDVEMFAGYSNPRFDRFIGQQVHIVAHDVINGDPVAVFRTPIDGDDTEQDYHAMVAGSFRPIRTPEQIAEEEREAEIIEIEQIAISGENSGKTWASAIYDAGYRKQEA